MENNKIYFETIKCDDYEIFNLDYHKKRIMNTIGLNINLSEYIYPPSNKLLKCKVIYNDYEILDIQYDEYKKREINSFKLIYNEDINYSKKFLNRENINILFEKREINDDIIIIKNNIVTDTSISNIAIYYENTWITSKECLLKGTTRQRLIEEKKLIEKNISLEMLKDASQIALMNAMIDFDVIKDYSFKL